MEDLNYEGQDHSIPYSFSHVQCTCIKLYYNGGYKFEEVECGEF